MKYTYISILLLPLNYGPVLSEELNVAIIGAGNLNLGISFE